MTIGFARFAHPPRGDITSTVVEAKEEGCGGDDEAEGDDAEGDEAEGEGDEAEGDEAGGGEAETQEGECGGETEQEKEQEGDDGEGEQRRGGQRGGGRQAGHDAEHLVFREKVRALSAASRDARGGSFSMEGANLGGLSDDESGDDGSETAADAEEGGVVGE